MAMGKALCRCKNASVLLLALVCVYIILAYDFAYAATAHFDVRLAGTGVDVTATLSELPEGNICLKFATISATKQRLDRRITNLRIATPQGTRLTMLVQAPGLYQVQHTQEPEILVRYTLQPEYRSWDHQLTSVTRTHMQLPVQYTFFTLYGPDKPYTQIATQRTMAISGLPDSWRVITTSDISKTGVISIGDDRDLVHAGIYDLKRITIGKTVFTVALNRELQRYQQTVAKMSDVLDLQYRTFGGYAPKEALIVINPLPVYAGTMTYGGQTIGNQSVLYTRPAGSLTLDPTMFLARLAHETFHLWLGQSFVLNEGVYWFTEGFTRYHEYRILQQLHLINEQDLARLLAREYIETSTAQRREPVSLRVAGARLFRTQAQQTLDYAKGALVAYLFDGALQTARVPGRNLESFFTSLYKTYAIPQKPMGNKEVVTAMNSFMGGDPYFTQRWILEATPLTPADVPAVTPYLKTAWLAALPNLVLDELISPWSMIVVLFGTVVCVYLVMRAKRKMS